MQGRSREQVISEGQTRPTRSGEAAVASGHPLSTAAALEILRDGGNAFDAVVASLAASFATEPVLCSPGGGGFLLAHPVGQAPQVLDFFAHTPGRTVAEHAGALDFLPLAVDFGPARQEFHVGRASAAVPGMIPGLCAMSSRLGRIPLARSLAPAIRLAREGVRVEPLQAHIMEVVAPILCHTAEARSYFSGGADAEVHGTSSTTAGAGSTMRSPLLAATLEALAEQGESLFREGAVASAMATLCAEGGLLRREDFAAYRVEWRAALERRALGARILSTPSPSAGGALVLFGLELADHLAHSAAGAASAGSGSQRIRSLPATDLAKVMRLTARARDRAALHEIVDEARVAALLDEKSLADACAALDALADTDTARKRGGTTHVSVIDAEGNAASCTVSNGEGCGHMVPGAGFMLNNMLGEEDLNPAGFFRWQANSRVTSMMAPTLAECADGRLLALGSGGSNRIRTALLQVLCRTLLGEETIADAVNAPRLHVEGDFLHIESGWDGQSIAALQTDWPQHQCWPHSSMFFGGVHAISRDASGRLSAAADPRRGGSAQVVTIF